MSNHFRAATAVQNEIDPSRAPSGTGCLECLRSDGWWFHLRRCAKCGHVGCCDSSPSQHARKHFAASGHRVIASFEPGEDWFYDYTDDSFIDGPQLAKPRWHPADQPAPAPPGRVPPDWQSRLNP
ncbi:MAG: UBP-type zinc finger domain-containing protein [Candidatus Velthaea sp.]